MKKFRRILVAGTATTMLFGSVLNVSAAGLTDIFDAEYYADSYADLKEAFGYDERQLYNHFITYGLKEGRNMSPILDVVAYREAYEDLDAAFGDDWDAYVNHFFTFGANEMRDQGVLFNPVIYADAYGDVKDVYGSDLMAITRHYLLFGRAEKRTIGTANGYADIAAARMAAARMAAQAAQQETSNDEWVDLLEASGIDEPGSNVPGTNTKKTDKPSVTVSWSSDGRTKYEYDNRGNCISEIHYDAAGNETESCHFKYNSNGDVVYSDYRDSAVGIYYQEERAYDGRKIINKKVYLNGSLNREEKYEWNGSKVKILRYNGNGELSQYSECETDSCLNITKEACHDKDGNLYYSMEYTYDENNHVLTQTEYDASGNQTDYYTYSYYENGFRKTESCTWGNCKYVREYNENGNVASYIRYKDGLIKMEQTYEYDAEGSLAKDVLTDNDSDGDTIHKETYYDSQGRTQKIIERGKYLNRNMKYEAITEYAADRSYTISTEYCNLAGTLTRKNFQKYTSKKVMLQSITHHYSDGTLSTVSVDEKDENGRDLQWFEYEEDEKTIIRGITHTYEDTEYGYVDTEKTLGAGGSVQDTLILMYDKDGYKLGDIISLEGGRRVERWDNGEKWYYSAEDKLERKEILWPNSSNIKAKYVYDADGKEITAAYEYDADGKEIELVQNAEGEWVRPSEGSGTGKSGARYALTSVFGSAAASVTGTESGAVIDANETGEKLYYTADGKLRSKEIWLDSDTKKALYEYDADGNEITAAYEYDADGNEIKLVKNEEGEWVRPSESSGSGETGSGEPGTGESGSGELGTGESGSGEAGTDESGSGETGTDEQGSGESGTDETGSDESDTSVSGNELH